MTPVERLHAAIAKLEAMQALGPVTGYEESNYAVLEFESGDSLALSVRPDYVLTLARTIEAQLALLGEALDYATDWHKGRPSVRGANPETIYRKELALAAAILGSDQ